VLYEIVDVPIEVKTQFFKVDGGAAQLAVLHPSCDATMQRLSATGFANKMAFTVKPGTYLVRCVVRVSDGERLTA
jgi:hypothetical protein